MKVPEGWKETKLGSAFLSRRSRGHDGLPTLSVTMNGGLVERHSLDRKTDTNLTANEHLLVKAGDIAYNMMRMWQGASGLAKHDAIVSPAYIVLQAKDCIDPTYAAYLFKTPRMIHLFWAYSYGLTNDRLRLYFKDLSIIPVNLPSIEEQKKIAEILSTWDRAIETVEKLIANSQAQKKALMQQLLTGNKRFPGFNGEWKEVKLKDVAELTAGGTPSTTNPEYWNGDIPWMNSGEINHRRIFDVEGRITKKGLKNSSTKIIPKFSVLIALAGQGKTRGKVSINHIHLCTNQSIAAILPSEKLFYEYLFHNLDSRYFELRSISLGDGGRGGLNLSVLKQVKLKLPRIKEQQEIANVLSTADREIVILKRQIDIFKSEKSALMQQLLTGKRRVKIDETKNA